jgi:DNA-binding XRE family transcriptional regulator
MVWSMAVTNAPGGLALARALRTAREEAHPGKQLRGSLRRLANTLEIAHTTLSQWETGKRIPRVEDVVRLLTVLGVTGDKFERIVDIARHARDANWVTVGVPGVSQALAGVMECERTCTTLTVWGPLTIPGLFQTGDFARRIMTRKNRPQGEIDARVAMRLGRREVLTRRNPPTMLALIGEPALRERIGGPQVMADQLRHILKVAAELDNVTVRVVRTGNDWHSGMSGPFELYTFPDTPPIVLLEHHRSSVFLSDDDRTEDVVDFVDAVVEIREVAMGEEESLALIAEILKETERNE